MPVAYKGTNARFLEIVEQPIFSKRKFCKKCGRYLPETDFPIMRNKDSHICMECFEKELV